MDIEASIRDLQEQIGKVYKNNLHVMEQLSEFKTSLIIDSLLKTEKGKIENFPEKRRIVMEKSLLQEAEDLTGEIFDRIHDNLSNADGGTWIYDPDEIYIKYEQLGDVLKRASKLYWQQESK